METKYKIAIFISIVSIVISIVSIVITLYLFKLKNDNQKTSNIKDNFDNFDINSNAYTTGVSINKGYDNYMEEIKNKEKYINCESYNFGLLGSSVVVGTINNSNDVDSVNKADKIDEAEVWD